MGEEVHWCRRHSHLQCTFSCHQLLVLGHQMVVLIQGTEAEQDRLVRADEMTGACQLVVGVVLDNSALALVLMGVRAEVKVQGQEQVHEVRLTVRM